MRCPMRRPFCVFGICLEQHKLTERIFVGVRALLLHERLLLKAGTIVDATLIAAPASTKNATRTRDPEMTQTKKGNQWHFGHEGTHRDEQTRAGAHAFHDYGGDSRQHRTA